MEHTERILAFNFLEASTNEAWPLSNDFLAQLNKKQFVFGICSHEHSSTLVSLAPRNICNWRFFLDHESSFTDSEATPNISSFPRETKHRGNYQKITLPFCQKQRKIASERAREVSEWLIEQDSFESVQSFIGTLHRLASREQFPGNRLNSSAPVRFPREFDETTIFRNVALHSRKCLPINH